MLCRGPLEWDGPFSIFTFVYSGLIFQKSAAKISIVLPLVFAQVLDSLFSKFCMKIIIY
jgi:hypothetical protein